MNIYGKTIQCECGKTHHVEPREVLYAHGAAQQLPALCERASTGRRVAVLMDQRTRAVAGLNVCRALAGDGWQVSEFIVPDPSPGHSPICDDVTKDKLAARIGPVDLFVPVGGGVVTDLSRWLALDRKLPFVSFGTAASMNGYASASIAGTVHGVKSLIYAHAPVSCLADPTIIENAPAELTSSGLGDVLAKSVSTTDWRLNEIVFGDYYCARSVGLIAEIEPLYFGRPEQIRAREPKAMEALFSALLLTGVSMNMAETSSPCSGAEHVISHTLDMMAGMDGIEHDLHGRQVGVGTILASELYRRVLAVENPTFKAGPGDVDRKFWRVLSDGVQAEYSGKVQRLSDAAVTLREAGRWDLLRETLSPMLRTPESLRDCLSRAGAAYKADQIRTTKPRLVQSMLHGHEIRSRFTILDLARLVGVLPTAAGEIVEQWG